MLNKMVINALIRSKYTNIYLERMDMALHKNLEKHIKILNELKELFNILSSLLISPKYSSYFNEEIKKAKYFKGEIFSKCYENHIIKYDKRYDTQRFKCKKWVRYLIKEYSLLFLV